MKLVNRLIFITLRFCNFLSGKCPLLVEGHTLAKTIQHKPFFLVYFIFICLFPCLFVRRGTVTRLHVWLPAQLMAPGL